MINNPQTRDILGAIKLYPAKLKAIYTFGSRVYGTYNESSDWDFVVVANTPDTNREINWFNLNIHLMTVDQYLQHLKEHRSFAVECFYAPKEFRLQELSRFVWQPNKKSLIHSFTHISNSAWDSFNARYEDNYQSALKCVFHSLRVPHFGIQILKSGKIENFKECNHFFEKLQSKNWTKEEIVSEFSEYREQVLYNFKRT
jgi:hypothetical protein